jgi:uncharacterized protein YjiS (DUF1127 family)
MQNIVTLPETQSGLHIRQFVSGCRQHAAAAWSRYMAWKMRRAGLRILRTLDDRTLQDIGLTRGDIDEAVRNLRRSAD